MCHGRSLAAVAVLGAPCPCLPNHSQRTAGVVSPQWVFTKITNEIRNLTDIQVEINPRSGGLIGIHSEALYGALRKKK
jgi:hypothetical protein